MQVDAGNTTLLNPVIHCFQYHVEKQWNLRYELFLLTAADNHVGTSIVAMYTILTDLYEISID